jgi:hypothetical protein
MRKAFWTAALISLSVAATAHADCSPREVLCVQEDITVGAEAAARLGAYLNRPLPDGVEATNLLEGGFQDGFIVARLESNDPGIPRFLELLALNDTDFFTETDYETAGDVLAGAAAAPDWWDWKTTTDLRVAKTRTTTLPHLAVGIASKPGVLDRYVIYLWGFET